MSGSLPLVIVDYGSGNLRSVAKAFERVMTENGISGSPLVSRRAEDVLRADRAVVPGVGAFADCIRGLRSLPGMIEVLDDRFRRGARPFLGICVGMQLLAEHGMEHGEHPGLGWIPGVVRPIDISCDPALKVPHMGWNVLTLDTPEHPLLAGTAEDTCVYFVHSYHFACTRPQHRLASVTYGSPLTAMIADGTVAGVQFHPEKSQTAGLRVLSNFMRWRP